MAVREKFFANLLPLLQQSWRVNRQAALAASVDVKLKAKGVPGFATDRPTDRPTASAPTRLFVFAFLRCVFQSSQRQRPYLYESILVFQ